MLDVLKEVNINGVIPVLSSDSKGLHLYIPLPKILDCDAVSRYFRYLFKVNAFEVSDGNLEIFPNKRSSSKRSFKCHKLVLQPGNTSKLFDLDLMEEIPIDDLHGSWTALCLLWDEARIKNAGFNLGIVQPNIAIYDAVDESGIWQRFLNQRVI